MAWTASDLTDLETAIRARITGNAIAEYRTNLQSVRYRDLSLEELRALRTEMRAELAADENGGDLTALAEVESF